MFVSLVHGNTSPFRAVLQVTVKLYTRWMQLHHEMTSHPRPLSACHFSIFSSLSHANFYVPSHSDVHSNAH